MDKKFSKLCDTYELFMNQFSDFQKEFKKERNLAKRNPIHKEVIDSEEEITQSVVVTKKQKIQPNKKTPKANARLKAVERCTPKKELEKSEFIEESEPEEDD